MGRVDRRIKEECRQADRVIKIMRQGYMTGTGQGGKKKNKKVKRKINKRSINYSPESSCVRETTKDTGSVKENLNNETTVVGGLED